MRGTIVFDGDCGFCRMWVDLWKKDPSVSFVPFQEAKIDGLEIASCMKAVQWIGADGIRASGAEAIFRMWNRGTWMQSLPLKAYISIPPFAWICRVGYGFVAEHRPFFSKLTKMLLRQP